MFVERASSLPTTKTRPICVSSTYDFHIPHKALPIPARKISKGWLLVVKLKTKFMQNFLGIKNCLLQNVKVENLKNIRGDTIMSPRTSIYYEWQQANCSPMMMRMIAATYAITALCFFSWYLLWMTLSVFSSGGLRMKEENHAVPIFSATLKFLLEWRTSYSS